MSEAQSSNPKKTELVPTHPLQYVWLMTSQVPVRGLSRDQFLVTMQATAQYLQGISHLERCTTVACI